jgi:hypothetical protein
MSGEIIDLMVDDTDTDEECNDGSPTNKFKAYYKRLRKRPVIQDLEEADGKPCILPNVSPNNLSEGKDSRIKRAMRRTYNIMMT